MATKRKAFARELLDALKGGNDASARSRPRSSDGAGNGNGNGAGTKRRRPANGAGPGASKPTRLSRKPVVPVPSRERRRSARSGRAERDDGVDLEDGPGTFVPPHTGDSVFQDVRGRARGLIQGFRESTNRAGDGLRALRERGGTGDGPATMPGRKRGGTGPPWHRSPGLPTPPGPPSGEGKNGPRLKKLRVLVVLLGVGLLAMVSWFFGIMLSVAQDLPQLENREQYKHAKNSIVTDRTGKPLTTLTNNDHRILVPSSQISQTMKQAVVAIEDQRFYEHRGVDFQGIGRAIIQDVVSRHAAQGASTITQQFVKNALRAQNSRTVFEKLREAALAYNLERHWSKDKILTQYLNSIYFGEGAYGIEAAAQTYFGWNHPGCGTRDDRCTDDLLPAEAALLAGMISSPSLYSPRTNPDGATERRNLVLDKMVEQGVLTPESAAQSKKEPIPKPSQINPPDENSESPYFTTWLRQQVVDRYGAGEAFGGGLKVTSTLDLDYQRAVENIAYSKLAGIAPTASIVVIDNNTGGVLAMVGGNDFDKEPFNLATNGHRQPGSSFKPFTLVTALEQGHSPDEVFTSQPKTFDFKVKGYKKPQEFHVNNYDDNYLGSASIATATQYSDNSVFAELGLGLDGGTKSIAKTAEKMGIQTKVSTNPAMILGGLETGVSPLEMAYAYSTLGRSGERIGGTMDSIPGKELGPTGIMKVTTEDDPDKPVEDKSGSSGENDVQTEQVIDPNAADTAVGLLENVVSSGTGERAATGDFAWGKTGTTDDNGDAWFCGGTDHITACVWVGHADSNASMDTEFGGQPVDGGTFPAEIWHDVVTAYGSIIGSPKEEDRRKKDGGSSSTDTFTPPSTSAPSTAAPATPAAPEQPAPAPPTGGGGGGGGWRWWWSGADHRRRHRRHRRLPLARPRRHAARRPGEGRGARQEAAACGAEPPRELRRARDPDTGADGDGRIEPVRGTFSELERRLQQAGAVVEELDADRVGELAGARAQLREPVAAAAGAHPVRPPPGLESADQHRCGLARWLAHGVQEAVHPVGEVHVRDPRRAEQGRVSPGAAGVGVAGRVVGVVALGLHDHPADPVEPQTAPDQIAGDLVDGAIEERRVERGRGHPSSSIARRAASSCSATRADAVPPAERFASSECSGRSTS